tara:strand:+ start:933 stop:1232 length:300 start_codon:yes stop_codon:yes gene_type:complete
MRYYQPHEVENKCELFGVELYIQFEEEWFVYFTDVMQYQSLVRKLVGSEEYKELIDFEADLVVQEGEPVEFSVYLRNSKFLEWEDWELFFHKIFTFIKV